MRILLSTSNKDKLKELSSILGNDYDLIIKSEVQLEDFDVVEDGETLRENAYKKAKELYDRTKENVISDDTGLFVEALDGAPGVYSARYAGIEHDYKANNDKLMREMSSYTDPEDRRAYFKTVICLITEEGDEYFVEGILEGRIGFKPKGNHGFGYDPLFILENGLSLAEISEEEKNSISHRAKALEELKRLLIKMKESEK